MSASAPRDARKLRLVEGPASLFAAHDDRPLVLHVIGSRADAARLASVVGALERAGGFRQLLIDAADADARAVAQRMRADIGLTGPCVSLEISGDSPGARTAAMVTEFERVLDDTGPELVVVAGGSDAALECALVGAKHGVAVANVEAGLRSWDWSTHEEINRVVTDRLSDTLFAHGAEAAATLRAEGVPESRIHTTGSTAVDLLRRFEPQARQRAAWVACGLREHEYVLVHLHHGSNVADPARLEAIVDAIAELAARTPVILPFHPLMRRCLEEQGLLEQLAIDGITCLPPIGYHDFLSLELGAGAIVTDSGGVQDEATALGVACFTLRLATEHNVTLTHGTNALLGDDPADIAGVHPLRRPPTPCVIPLWDGRAGERVADALVANYALMSSARAGD